MTIKAQYTVWYMKDMSVEDKHMSNDTDCVQKGDRPVIIVSNNVGNVHSDIVTVVPLTSKEKKYLPTHCTLMVRGILNTALCEQIMTINQSSLTTFITALLPEVQTSLNIALYALFNFNQKYINTSVQNELRSHLISVDKEKFAKEIEEVTQLRDQFNARLELLEKELHIISTQNTELLHHDYNVFTMQKSSVQRKYIKRSIEEIASFMFDWTTQSIAHATTATKYNFSTVESAQAFYYKYKHDKRYLDYISRVSVDIKAVKP